MDVTEDGAARASYQAYQQVAFWFSNSHTHTRVHVSAHTYIPQCIHTATFAQASLGKIPSSQQLQIKPPTPNAHTHALTYLGVKRAYLSARSSIPQPLSPRLI